MMFDIDVISNDMAINFLKANKASKEVVFYRSHNKWYGVFAQGHLCGVTGIDYKEKYNEICGVFVEKRYRNLGVGTLLNNTVIEENGNKKLIVYARPVEAHILSKYGFVVKQTLKNQTVKMERGVNNG